MVAQAPGQIAVGDAAAEITASGFTITWTVRVPEQPDACPETVYTVVTVGDTVTGFPDKPPGFQEYVAAPDAESTAEAPKQIAVGEALAVIVGFGTTVIAIVF